MATKTLGKVSLTMGGNYDSTATYARLTIVHGNDRNSYVTKADGVSGVEPGVDVGWEDYYQLLCESGNLEEIEVNPILSTGTKIATITIGEDTYDLYVPDDSELPSGGNAGDVLMKTADGLEWSDELTDALSAINESAPVIHSSSSGSLVHIEDGADNRPMSCVVGIEPVQDLHGYANPWPAGGGINKWDESKAYSSSGYTLTDGVWTQSVSYSTGGRFIQYTNGLTISDGETITISADVKISKDGENTSKAVRLGLKYSSDAGSYSKNSDVTVTDFDTWQRISCTLETSGSTAIWIGIQPRYDEHTVTFKNVQVEFGATAHAYAPYSNICPITGWTGATVTRTGKNMSSLNTLPGEPRQFWGGDNAELKAVLNALPAGTYTIYGTFEIVTAPGNGKCEHGRPYITALVNGTQTPLLSYNVAVDSSATVGKTYRDGGTFTITEGARGNINHCYLYCDQQTTHSGNDRGTYILKEIQLEVGSTATAYEPYQGNTYPISWTESGTVYGGTIDLDTGVMTVDRAYRQETATEFEAFSSSNCGYNSSTAAVGGAPTVWFRNLFNSYGAKQRVAGGIKAVCNMFALTFNNTSISSSQNRCAFVVDGVSINSVETFVAAVRAEEQNGGGLYIAYELDTPLTIQLSPVEIRTLYGVNNLWADTGDMTVKYPADTKLYIDGLTAPDADMVADANIANGKYFMVNNHLYLSTAAIAAGETIIPGTNCTETNLAAALNALNS